MKLYTVTDAYIAYLKGIDSKVLNNYGGIRPYVGIIIEIGGHKYLAPLTSYKAKQEKLNNNLPTIIIISLLFSRFMKKENRQISWD
ncbi:type III toxin-antitoxin system ToxN/AbiQ family toxin [Pseudomonas synxantha]|uniref:type III toxin-antitoxin system ToxN/AbiQ family toxin n=1 Tax=Pseudomonas synxantha TaxID=47883 RepID=UPI000698FACC|nr:type III toxin-antitoxin system ToxN/AbiQ family toxin [Pseudomonas synxantha]